LAGRTIVRLGRVVTPAQGYSRSDVDRFLADVTEHSSEDLWVFGYGSLMWNPGFAHTESLSARLHGYHRSLCIWSWVYRGTQKRPGLVLGLDSGGSCWGRGFRVSKRNRRAAVDYLFGRELVTAVYHPIIHPVQITDGRKVNALAFKVNRQSPQYAGKLPPEHAARTVSASSGRHGANVEYVTNTCAHLEELGIHDAVLSHIASLVKR